jgi:hypothetical protein
MLDCSKASLTDIIHSLRYNLTAQFGYQWVGNSDAQTGFDIEKVENPQANFAGMSSLFNTCGFKPRAGMMFLTEAYGVDPGAITWQVITYTDQALFQNQGGLDPFVVRQRDFQITSLSPWAQMKIRLAIDAIWLFGWITTRGVENKVTINNSWSKILAAARAPIPMNSGGIVYIDSNLDREVCSSYHSPLRAD